MSAFNERYCRAGMERIVPTSTRLEHLKRLEGLSDEEQIALKEKLAQEIEETCPYKPGREPKTLGNVAETIKQKRLNQWNWLNHLDEMTDEEIEYMLKTAPDAKRLAEELTSDPMPVRKFAEEMRDLY